jgi:predicted GIY-YIG superfamily endonuclease
MPRQPVSQGMTSVYIARDEQGRVVYVGITSQGASRNGQHWKKSEWWRHHVSQTKEDYPTRRQALARETQLIRAHKPPFNKQQNPGWEHLLRKYLETVEPHRYGHAAALEMAVALDWWIPLYPISRRPHAAQFEVSLEHTEITTRWLPTHLEVASEFGDMIGRFAASHLGSGKTHNIQFDEFLESTPSCARVQVCAIPGTERFRAIAVEVSWRLPAPWLPVLGGTAAPLPAAVGGA